MHWDKFNARFDPGSAPNFRLQFDAVAYAIGVFLLPFLAIHSFADLGRLWWLFLPAIILSVAVYLTVRSLTKVHYVKKPLNLTETD
jgi:hypothetical protein